MGHFSLTCIASGLPFHRLLHTARSHYPSLEVSLRIGDAAEFPLPRDHAYCEVVSRSPIRCRVTVAPKLKRAPKHRQEGVLRHEIGHAVLLTFTSGDHTERQCDEMAEHLFGAPIRYDAEDVQTTRRDGVTPRPARLPK